MTIKKLKVNTMKVDLEKIKNEMDKLIRIHNVPKTIREELLKTKKFINDYDLHENNTTLQTLTGNILTKEEILDIVIKASGYNKWDIDEEKNKDNEYYADTYGIDVKNFITYHVTRNLNNRDRICVVSIFCFPGYVGIDLATDRAGWTLDDLIENKDILHFLTRELEDD